MNPNIIDGWHYNPASEGWYRRSILDGQVDPDSLASAEKASELNNQRYWRELYNRIEGVSAANDAAGSITKPDVWEIIKNIPEIYNRYIEIFPEILIDLRNYFSIWDNVNINFRSAQAVQIYRDPIVLDLDGDGLELISSDGHIVFDHNADGISTGTGWVKSDDGILVHDLNSDGRIDSGRELFGDQTIKRDGNFAKNGFDALSDLDSNSDGNFTSADEAWRQIQVWRDQNQDGISQSNELFSLDELGITCIGLNANASGMFIDGNRVEQKATFTRNGNDQAVGTIDLQQNGFYREFSTPVELTDAAKNLPNIKGAGWVRDLREAASLSSELFDALIAYGKATTREAQVQQLDSLLLAWAKSSGQWASLEQQFRATKVDIHMPANSMDSEAFRQMLALLEVFNGTRFYQASPTQRAAEGLSQRRSEVGGVLSQEIIYDVAPLPQQVDGLQNSLNVLRESVYEALVLQTRLKPYLNLVQLEINENGISFNTTELTATLENAHSTDVKTALIDLIELNRYASATLRGIGYQGMDTLRGWIAALPAGSPLFQELTALNVHINGTTTSGTDKNDIYLGTAGDNSFNARAGNDILDGGDGNDYLYGEAGDDSLLGGAGNDTLYGGNGNDTLEGGAGNDYLNGEGGSDTYVFNSGWGQDTINNYDTTSSRSDVIAFGEGITTTDVIATRSGEDLILSLRNGSDKITVQYYFSGDGAGAYHVDLIRFADGTSWDVAAVKALVQVPTSGADNLYGYASDDVLNGLDGNDTLRGYAGNDTLRGDAGADTLYGGDGNDTVDGGADNDYLYGENGDDSLLGGAGNDTLYGGSGNDTLEGGAGNDYLSGEGGSDTYVFNSGWGQDTINNYDTTSGRSDVIAFGTGIAATDVIATRSGEDLILSLRNGSDKVTVQYYFSSDATGPYRIDQVRFADRTTWDVAAVKALVQVPTSGADNLYGYASDDVLNGLDGNNTLRGYAGNDTLRGDAGADTLYGGDGNDSIDGGADNDYLYGENGDDSLLGGAGNDTLYGGSGNDTLEGGAGNDYLSGEGGSDTYVFNAGWGQDTIGNYDSTSGRSDVIAFGTGIAATDVIATRSGEDLILSLRNGSDKATVQYYFSNDATGPYRIDQVRFADGTSWDVAAVKALVQVPTSGADNLYGYASDDVLNGLDGNDTLRGYAGNDTLRGDAGADTLYGGDGNDSVDGGADNDYLYGENGDDSLLGGAGNDTLYGGSGNDTLEGGAGNDYLSGEGGSDTYVFNAGWGQDTIGNYDSTSGRSDVIAFGTGIAATDVIATRSGEDLILSLRNGSDKVTVQYYFSGDGTGAYRVDLIRFADGTTWDVNTVSAKTIGATNAADNLYGYATDDEINGLNGNDTIRGYGGNDTLRGDAGADTLYGGDGNDTVDGGADNDYLYGENGDDNLLGGAGNDTLYGGSGNDTLEGGAGNDYLSGEGGSDTYVFNPGWGQDTINNYDTTSGRADVIAFGEGIAATDVIATRSGEDLILSLRNGSDRITVQYYFSSDTTGPYRIDQVRFADGTSWDVAAVKALVQVPTSGADNLYGYASDDVLNGLDGNDTLRGYGGNDTLRGDAGADTLYGGDGNDTVDGGADNDYLYGENGDDSLLGGSGNDTLYGGSGNDTLEGGAGNDYLSGEGGSDTYVFNSGWGQDTINNYDTTSGRSDVIAFGTGIAATDVIATRSGEDLILSLRNGSDRVTVQYYFSSDATGPYRIDQVRFADGTTWDVAAVKALVQVPSSGDDNLYGYASDDVLNGLDGNDTLRGYGGNDTLRGDAGADTLYGGDGNDVLDGGADNDYLYGENGDDSLLGGSGNDTLYGGSGNDTLEGGAGNDYLNGNEGSDTYVFNSGWGQDTIYNYDTTSGRSDVIAFGTGIATDQLWFRRVNGDLEVSLIGSTDKTTLSNWYAGSVYHVDQFTTADGKRLSDTQVDSLVQAMAAFSPPVSGQTTLPQNYRDALEGVIAANWK
ncbi:calcium-binding protein [Ralstonia solanacearum]|uniref:calcium-binding protein n=1 Tax=Ralstonia solanacearum TaxID=305 RepID=UPI0022A9FCCB|nr:calcium-binding protein [Ralstonia solanacearum]